VFDKPVRFAIGRLKPGGGVEFGARTRSWKRRKQTRNTYPRRAFLYSETATRSRRLRN